MSTKNLVLTILFAFLFIGGSFAQETFTHPVANVSITLPAGWLYENSENTMLAYTANKELAVHFMVLDTDALDAALAEIDKYLDKEIKNLKIDDAKKIDMNGMSAIAVEGRGDGMELGFVIVDTPTAGKSLFIGAWATPEMVKKNEKDIDLIFSSIKPVK